MYSFLSLWNNAAHSLGVYTIYKTILYIYIVYMYTIPVLFCHIRRIKTEEKANSVADVWGPPCSYFEPGWFEERNYSNYSIQYGPGAIHPILPIVLVQFILFFKLSWCKKHSKEWNKFCPPSCSDNLCLLFCLYSILLLWLLLIGLRGGRGFVLYTDPN